MALEKELIDRLTVLFTEKLQILAGKAAAIEAAESVLAFRHSLEADNTLNSMEVLMIQAGLHEEFTYFREHYHENQRTKVLASTAVPEQPASPDQGQSQSD